jgi:isopentenyl-diphosphate Delta-isomerase
LKTSGRFASLLFRAATQPAQSKDHNTMSEELFDVVDQQDRVLRQAPRTVVHANHWLHRAAHIFVFNSRGELLVHRRSATKDECPRMHTSSASGHLGAGEDYATAAARELQEELGLTSPVEFLTIVPADGAATSFEHSALFRTTTDEAPVFDPEEIESGEFLPLDEISARIEQNPSDFTPCFLTLFRWYCERFGTV